VKARHLVLLLLSAALYALLAAQASSSLRLRALALHQPHTASSASALRFASEG
jgi:hypothetical protein